MPTAFIQRLRRLPGDDRAATAVEFAMLAPPLIFLILASLQLSIIFFAGQVLQSAATLAGREIMTGQAQTAGDSASQYQSAVCATAPSLFGATGTIFTCGDLMVDVESAPSYSSLNPATLTPTYDSNGNPTKTFAYSPGGPGDIVIVRVMYDWPVVAGPLLPGLADQSNNGRLLVATSVFKNEPYQ